MLGGSGILLEVARSGLDLGSSGGRVVWVGLWIAGCRVDGEIEVGIRPEYLHMEQVGGLFIKYYSHQRRLRSGSQEARSFLKSLSLEG